MIQVCVYDPAFVCFTNTGKSNTGYKIVNLLFRFVSSFFVPTFRSKKLHHAWKISLCWTKFTATCMRLNITEQWGLKNVFIVEGNKKCFGKWIAHVNRIGKHLRVCVCYISYENMGLRVYKNIFIHFQALMMMAFVLCKMYKKEREARTVAKNFDRTD